MARASDVFIVDDDPAVRDSLKLLLQAYGHDVRDFESGEDFLRAYDAALAGCLVLDVHMPPINGVELVERLSASGALPPTVLISGHLTEEIRSRGLAAGAVAVLEKPFDGVALVTLIERALRAAPPAP